jgi:hypothetical protein
VSAQSGEDQTLVCKLVDQVQHAVLPSVMGPILHEVIAPDVIGPFGSQPDAGSVRKPQTPSLGLFGRHLEPLPPPDPLDPPVVDNPAGGRAQEFCDPPVAVASILTGKHDGIGSEPILIASPARNTSLRRTMLSQHAADPPLGQLQFGSYLVDAGAATGGAQKFC